MTTRPCRQMNGIATFAPASFMFGDFRPAPCYPRRVSWFTLRARRAATAGARRRTHTHHLRAHYWSTSVGRLRRCHCLLHLRGCTYVLLRFPPTRFRSSGSSFSRSTRRSLFTPGFQLSFLCVAVLHWDIPRICRVTNTRKTDDESRSTTERVLRALLRLSAECTW